MNDGKESKDIKEQTIVFVTNSELDGFKEGDGDLMDKLVSNFRNDGIEAIRVVKSAENVPEDKLDYKGLIYLSKEWDKNPQSFEKSLSNLFSNEKYKNKTKILYIGSRFDLIDTMEEKNPIKTGSGALFTQAFITKLKSEGVKIVTCCLEYKFFKRSIHELPKAALMMKNQLFLSDQIHFLNKLDKEDYENTLINLLDNNTLQPLKPINDFIEKQEIAIKKEKEIKVEIKSEEIKTSSTQKILGELSTPEQKETKDEKKQVSINEKKFFNGIAEKFLKFDETEVKKQITAKKGVFVSGIYTVDPIEDKDIMPNKEDNLISKLKSREANILCFGIIRGAKGLVEAVELGKEFKEHGKKNKVIICGKAMGNIGKLFEILLEGIYGRGKKTRAKIKSILLTKLKNYYELKLIKNSEENKDMLDNSDNLFSRLSVDIFTGNKAYNMFLQDFYSDLQKQMPENNIEFHFGLDEQALKQQAMRCQYAIKLDHKGMANNASTIASCLGMYLPTITSSGFLTDDIFKKGGKYDKVVIMDESECKVEINAKKELELLPEKAKISKIYDIIIKDKEYDTRLCQLIELKKEGVFDSKVVANKIWDEILQPIAKQAVTINKSSEIEIQHKETPKFEI